MWGPARAPGRLALRVQASVCQRIAYIESFDIVIDGLDGITRPLSCCCTRAQVIAHNIVRLWPAGTRCA